MDVVENVSRTQRAISFYNVLDFAGGFGAGPVLQAILAGEGGVDVPRELNLKIGSLRSNNIGADLEFLRETTLDFGNDVTDEVALFCRLGAEHELDN